MMVRGKVLRLISGESLIIRIGYKMREIDIIIPLKFKEYFSVIPKKSVLTLSGDFEIFDSKIYFNESLKLDFGEDNTCKTFTKMKDIEKGKKYNIIGIVVDWYEPRKSRGSDFVTTINVIDDTVEEKVKIRIFSKEKTFEKGFFPGDIIEIFCVKALESNLCISSQCFDLRLLYSEYGHQDDTFFAEKEPVKSLLSYYSVAKDKFSRLKDISEMKNQNYCDFVGEVLAVQIESENLVILTATDYTGSKEIEEKIPVMGLKNTMIVFIKAWGIYARYVKDYRAGDIVLFKNLKINIQNGIIVGNLSESIHCYINKVLEINPLLKIFLRKKKSFLNNMEDKRRDIPVPQRFQLFSLTNVSELKGSGFYRIRVYIKYTIPFSPQILYRCSACNIARIFPLKNCRSTCQMFEEKICKAVVCDQTGSLVVICKNNILESIFLDKNKIFLRHNYFESILARFSTTVGMVNHIVDASFM